MGYKLNEEGWQAMEELAQKLSCLSDGESVILKDNRASIDRFRYVIYAWLYETGKKQEFKLIRRSPESLEIRKKAVLNPQISVEDKIQDFVSCHLIEVEDELEVTERIRKAVQSSAITADQGVNALREWHRIQGRA